MRVRRWLSLHPCQIHPSIVSNPSVYQSPNGGKKKLLEAWEYRLQNEQPKCKWKDTEKSSTKKTQHIWNLTHYRYKQRIHMTIHIVSHDTYMPSKDIVTDIIRHDKYKCENLVMIYCHNYFLSFYLIYWHHLWDFVSKRRAGTEKRDVETTRCYSSFSLKMFID